MNRAEKRRQKKIAKKAASNAKLGKATIPSPGQQTPTIQQSLELAVRHHNAGDLAKAEGIYQQVLQADPNQPIALHLLGVIAHQVGNHDTAVDLINKAIAINPDYAEAHNNLGNALQVLGRLDEAVASFNKAIAIKPDLAEAHSNLGTALQDLGRLDEAVTSFHKALNIQPDYAEAHSNLGVALQKLGKLDEAVASHHKALAIKPDLAEAHNNLGAVLQDLEGPDEAVASYRKALAIKPDYVQAHKNLGLISLLMGDFETGWPEYSWRLLEDDSVLKIRAYPQPLWDGSDLGGRTVLLYAEQGFGDTIQFLRYLPMVAAPGTDKGGDVILQCPPPLTRLFEAAPAADGIQLVTKIGDTPFDLQAPLHDLPGLFATTLYTIPADVPYLRPPGDTPPALETSGGFKVGLVWAGNSKHKNDANRSVGFERFQPLLDIKGVDFYSLQVGERSRDIGAPGLSGLDGKISDLGKDLGDFADTAAAVGQLDLVITVDTSVAHLAGALGTPVWTLLPWVPDWRWLLDRDDSPWYPTMRLFRQPAAGDWDAVIGEVGAALRDQVEGGS